MHPEADAFLDAIFDHPDDDTPRLVYADWLQEHGQENYAQFIRLQCAAAREKLWSDEANRLWEEIGRVWNRLYDDWWPATTDPWGWGRFDDQMLDAIHFKRGFLRTHLPIFVEQIRDYPACWAWLPSCDVCFQRFDDLESLAEMPIARRLRKVRVAFRLMDSPQQNRMHICLDAFGRSEFTRGVRVLDLSAVPLREKMVEALLCERAFPRLEELHVMFGGYEAEYCVPSTATRQLEARFKRVVIK